MSAANGGVDPRAELASLLTTALAERLGVAAGAIDPAEPFARYGLDSAGAVAFVAEVGKRLGRRLPATLMWTCPTVDDLARHLAGGAGLTPRADRAAAAPSAAAADEPVAVVGMAGRFPGAPSVPAFWRLLCDGTDAVGVTPAGRWSPEAGAPTLGGFLEEIDGFDPLFFGISPVEAGEMDPQQRLMLEASWEALEDAGVPPRALAGSRTGVFFGVVWRDYADLHHATGARITSHTGVGQAPAIVPNRVSYALGLQGPSLAVDTACSSSLVAVHLACRSLRDGESEIALAGGVNLTLSPEVVRVLTEFGGLSPTGRCRAFADGADGFVRGEGAGVVVLKRLSRAIADGDRIYCVIRGSAMNNDGPSNGLTAPNPLAQEAVLRDAYRRAGVDPARVHYVEAHGTGTPLGDPIEAQALGAVFGAGRDDSRPLRLGSVKTNIGHLEGAAGVAGLIKAALAIHHRALPASLFAARPHPGIPFDELRLRLQVEAGPWPDADEAPLAGVSAFGWGGTNCHLVLEGAPARASQVMFLSADTPAELAALAAAERERAASLPLRAACEEAARRPAAAVRRAVAARTRDELAAGLDALAAELSRERSTETRGAAPGKLAFVFSGLGCQWPGMGAELLATEPVFRATVDRCDRAMRPRLGWSVLEELAAPGATGRWGERGDHVAVIQPVLFTWQVALAALLRSWGVVPDVVVGHSLGEIAAAYVAGVLELEDAARVVAAYIAGQAPTVGKGGVGIVQRPADEVEEALRGWGGRVEVAGTNSPKSTLIAGEWDALDEFVARLQGEGVFAARVRMDIPAHCSLVDPILPGVSRALRSVRPRPASIPLVSTITGRPIDGRDMDGEYWARELRERIVFADVIAQLEADGVAALVEIGPHAVMGSTLRECLANPDALVLPTARRGEEARRVLGDTLAALWSGGFPVDGAAFVRGGSPDEGEDSPQLIPLSARTPEALRDAARDAAAALRSGDAARLEAAAHTAALRRSHHEHRLAVVAASVGEAVATLDAAAAGEAAAGLVRGRTRRGERPETVFVYSGQGSQWRGMGRELLRYDAFRRACEESDDELARVLGFSLLERLEDEGAGDLLDRTEIAQPAIFALQVGLTALWRSWGVAPDAVVGHSMGEVAAAWAAGILSLRDAATLVAHRGQAMAPLRGQGRMVAVTGAPDEVRALVAPLGVEIAAVNAPASVVLSGAPEAVAQAVALLGERGMRCREMPGTYAFHSAQTEAVREAFAARLTGLEPRTAELRFVSTVTGGALAGPELDTGYWARNLRDPVLFADAAAAATPSGSAVFLELGPHPVLSVPLVRSLEEAGRTDPVLASLRRDRDGRRTTLESLGALYAAGYPVEWGTLYPVAHPPAALPPYPFQRQRFWFQPHVRRPAAVVPPSAEGEVPVSEKATVAADAESTVAARLSSVFASLTGIPAGDIDPGVPFLELGAESIVLLQVVRTIQDEYGVELSMRQLFGDLSTLGSLAAHVARASDRVAPPPAAAPPADAAPAERRVQVLALAPHANGAASHGAPAAPAAGVESLLAQQLEAFSRGFRDLAAQQIQALGLTAPAEAVPAATPRPAVTTASAPAPAPAASTGAAADGANRPAVYVPHQPLKVHERAELDARQGRHLRALIERYTARTPRSKEMTQASRAVFVDNRSSAGFRPAIKEMLYPIVGDRSRGARIWDVDGNEYIDISMGFGVSLLGHNPPFVTEAVREQLERGIALGPQSPIAGEVAAMIARMTGVERVAFTNTGTEAVMTALRLARTATGRRRVGIFRGAYHGHSDAVLVVPGMDGGPTQPMAPGVSAGAAQEMIPLEYGSPRSLEILRAHAGELAAVIVEPVQSRRPDQHFRDFLHELRAFTREHGIALVFDEVITGFRTHPGGAQAWFGVRADLVTYGKVVGGGLPIGVVAGNAAFLDGIDGGMWAYGDDSYPAAKTTFFAGTFCKHPLAMVSARAVLRHLEREGPALQENLNRRTAKLAERLNAWFADEELPLEIGHFGSMWRILSKHDIDLLYYHLAERGVFVWEGRTLFLSTEHTDDDLARVAEAIQASALALREGGFLPARKSPTPPPSPAREPREHALTAAQREVWSLAQLGPDASATFNNHVCLRIDGDLDRARLFAALQAVVDRHEALRTTVDETEATQRVLPRLPVEPAFHDLSALPEPERAAEVERLLREERAAPFDLASGPLLRALLLKEGDGAHLLAIGAHQIVADGWSFGVILQELGECYAGAVDLPAAVPFSAYAERDAERLDGPEAERDRAYWAARLDGPLPRLPMPFDRPRGAVQEYAGAEALGRLDAIATKALQRLAASRGCTLYMVLLAAFQTLLRRVTGERETIVAVPAGGQAFGGTERMVGNCLTLLPIRAAGGDDPAFEEYLATVRDALLEAFDHERVSFAAVLEGLTPVPDASRWPIFNVDQHLPLPRVPGLDIGFHPMPRTHCNFDLGLNVVPEGDELLLAMEYKSGLWDAATVDLLVRYLETLLRDVAAHPGRRLSELALAEDADGAPAADAEGRVVLDGRGRAVPPLAVGEVHGSDGAPGVAGRWRRDGRLELVGGDGADGDGGVPYVAPRTAVEEELAAIWSQVLAAPQVGVHDSFFALGGHSLLATQMVSRIRAAFGVEIPLRSTFEAPTVALLAARIDEARRRGDAPSRLVLERAPGDGDAPLSYAQQRMWLAVQLDPASPAWNIPTMLRVRGTLDGDALARTLTEVVRRHEALRTTFHLAGETPVQRVSPPAPVPLPLIDLSHLHEPDGELLRLARAEAARPFDLAADTLLRATWVFLGEEEHALLVTMHHIAADGWSAAVLLDELKALYPAFVAGRPSPLPELEIQYRDFAASQQRWLAGGALEGQREHWRRALAGAGPLAGLPVTRPRVGDGPAPGVFRAFQVDGTAYGALRALADEERATVFIALLATLTGLLHRVTDARDITVGTDVASRTDARTEALIGFFVNVLALRTRIPEGITFRGLLRAVRETALDAYANQELPYEIVLKEQGLGGSSLFNVFFVTETAADAEIELPGATARPLAVENGVAIRDLALYAVERPDGVHCTWNYPAGLFDPDTIDALSARFVRLLQAGVADPDGALDEIDLRLEHERQAAASSRERQRRALLSRKDSSSTAVTIA
ncbi:MAG TPA: aminotransferase class III-fold pyridoxal phosphate-dependent enzyme [Longimicrobium sp.]